MSITSAEETKKNNVSCNWTGLEDLGSLTGLRGKHSQPCLQFISWSVTSGAFAAHCPAHSSTECQQREVLRTRWPPNSRASSRAQGQGAAHAGAASRPGHAAAAEQGLSCFPRASLPHLPALALAQPAGSAHHTWHSARWLAPFCSAPKTRLCCNPLPTPLHTAQNKKLCELDLLIA